MAYEPKTWVKGETVTPLALNNMENALAEANGDYVPHEWQCGEAVTAELLNHIEQGIANAGGGDEHGIYIVVPDSQITLGGGGLTFSSPQKNAIKEIIVNDGVSALYTNEAFEGAKESLERVIVKNGMQLHMGALSELGVLKEVILLSQPSVGDGVFSNDTALEHVYLPSDVTQISATAFMNCTQSNLVIDCGFAEGAVSGAPWGATNATINYNVPAPTDI